MIDLDKFTFLTLELALFSSYTMAFGNVEQEIGYTKKELEQLDKKYENASKFSIDEIDLPLIVKTMEWMLIIRDESELLGISQEEGLKLLSLLTERQKTITSEDWLFPTQNLGGIEYYGDTKKGNVYIEKEVGNPTLFPTIDPSGYIRKSVSKDQLLRDSNRRRYSRFIR